MSVVNQFDASNLKYSHDPKQVYIVDLNGGHGIFAFDIYCIAKTSVCNVGFFFNIQQHKVLIFMKQSASRYVCAIMRFHVVNDVPIMSANWLMGQENIVELIHDEFRRQYAEYLLDNVINE